MWLTVSPPFVSPSMVPTHVLDLDSSGMDYMASGSAVSRYNPKTDLKLWL